VAIAEKDTKKDDKEIKKATEKNIKKVEQKATKNLEACKTDALESIVATKSWVFRSPMTNISSFPFFFF